MRYRRIYLIGFDGIDSKYFYEKDVKEGKVDAADDITGRVGRAENLAAEGEGGGKKNYFLAKWGIEAMVSVFAAYNGIRLVNLSQRSLFQKFLYTETINEAVVYLRERARSLLDISTRAHGRPPGATPSATSGAQDVALPPAPVTQNQAPVQPPASTGV